MKINLKDVHKYVEKHQTQLGSLKAYFNKYEENSANSAKIIVQINEEIKKNLKSITQDKPTVKTIKQFSQNIEEKQSNQKIVEFLKFKLKNWIQICQNILSEIREKLRTVDLKYQKKQLTEKQILEFKTFLIQAITSFQENKQAILSHFSHLQISCNALLLESLTNKIQRLGNQ